MRGVRSRAARGLLVGTALVLAVGGCTDEPEEVTRTSGALTEGFEIEPGSGLVGTVFPLGYSAGHQAVLRVDGDLHDVFEGYVRQAEELGHPVQAPPWSRPGEWCTDPGDGTDDQIVGDEAIDDDPVDDPFPVECTAISFDPGEHVVSLRGLAESDGSGYIHLEVQSSFDGEEPPPLEPDGPVASVTDDEPAPELAVPEDNPPVRLVDGSRPVMDPLPATCATGGFLTVLQVTGDLLPVMRGYAEQFSAMTAFETEGLVGSQDEPLLWASAAGGGDLAAVGVAGDPSYVLIDRCND